MKAREVNGKIEKAGGYVLRQKGSHRFYEIEIDDKSARTTVAQHTGDIPNGTLRQIEKDLESVLGKGWLR